MLSCLVLTTASCNNRDINAAEVLTYGVPDISDSDSDKFIKKFTCCNITHTAISMCNALFNGLNVTVAVT